MPVFERQCLFDALNDKIEEINEANEVSGKKDK